MENSHLQCDVCEKPFKQPSALTVHKRIHSGERPHICDFCGKGFTQAGTLTVHRRLHSEERPYGCEVCQRSFTNSSALSRHKKTHTGEKSHECDVCLKKFADKGGLKIHKRIHTNEMPYECEICQKRFRQAGPYKYHKQSHGKEVYDCGVCKKVFKNSMCLRRHHLHYEKSPYKCDVCKCKSFADSEQFERHKKSHSHLCNCYYAGLFPSKKKSGSEPPNVILKEDGGKSFRYLACNKESCGEAFLHYHKTVLDKNHDRSEDCNLPHSEKLRPDGILENQSLCEKMSILSESISSSEAKDANNELETGNSDKFLNDGADEQTK